MTSLAQYATQLDAAAPRIARVSTTSSAARWFNCVLAIATMALVVVAAAQSA